MQGLDRPGLIAFLYGALAFVSIIFPRGVPVFFCVAGALGIAGNLLRRDAPRTWLHTGPATIAALAFLAWALLATTWSSSGLEAVAKVFAMAMLVVVTGVTVLSASRSDRVMLTWVCQGLVIGVILGGLYVAIETLSNQILVRSIYENFPSLQGEMRKHLGIKEGKVWYLTPTNINRQTANLVLLFWPAAWAVWYLFSGQLRKVLLAVLIGLAVAILLKTEHQSSQLAFALSGSMLALSSWSPAVARRTIQAAWCVAVMLVVPICYALAANNFQQNSALGMSAKSRIPIWGYTAERVLDAPFIGIGTGSTTALHDKIRDDRRIQEKENHSQQPSERKWSVPRLGRHSHNIYLQTWFELGAVGAVLLLISGLVLLSEIGKLRPDRQVLPLTVFATVGSLIATSYSIWQLWILAGIALSAFFTSVVMLRQEAQQTTQTSVP